MDRLASYCLTEPGAGFDAAALRTRAVRKGDEGAKGVSTFRVEGETPGLKFVANARKMGWNAQPTRALIFEDCCDEPVGAGGAGFKIAMAGLDGGRLNIGACSLVGAQAALEKVLAYMKERNSFLPRLDEFQA